MKHNLLFIFIIIFSQTLIGQNFEIYTGVNTSKVNVVTKYTNKEPGYAGTIFKIFPKIGYNMSTKIRKNLTLKYGVELAQFGCKNYLQLDRSTLDSFNFDKDLIVSQLNFSVNPTFKTKYFDLHVGYSLGYVFDKNQNFLYYKDFSVFDFHSGFNVLSHQINAGITYKYKSNFVRINGRISLTPLSEVNSDQIDVSDNPTFLSSKVTYTNFSLVIGREF